MELLIVKTGGQYLRFKDGAILEVGLDKASVFPMDRMAHVRALEQQAAAEGFKDIRIKKLVLTEEDL
ncbi:MAG: hypothetical protein HUN04_20950 [Desulfobacter sp.]|nr:MAG: hypothetical protein HUN04_20950 [Desulfobacter sp.]